MLSGAHPVPVAAAVSRFTARTDMPSRGSPAWENNASGDFLVEVPTLDECEVSTVLGRGLLAEALGRAATWRFCCVTAGGPGPLGGQQMSSKPCPG